MLGNIIQETHNLIGSTEAINKLKEKDHARILIISDSHGKTSTFIDIVYRYGKECDALIFCGDGAGDLAALLNGALCDNELNTCIPPVIAFVAGNGDPSIYPVNGDKILSFPDKQTLSVNGTDILIVHGHMQAVDFGLEQLKQEMSDNNCKIAFYGHTHIAREDNEDGLKIANPGSCARPRGGQPQCFAIATVEKKFVDIAYIKMTLQNDGKTVFQIWNPIF